MSIINHKTPRLKLLLNDLPPGFMIDTACLRARGIDSKSTHNYVGQGWLEHIVRGVYRRPLSNRVESDKLSWQVVLLSLQQIMGYNLHLGGRSALGFAGYTQFITTGEKQYVDFYGDAPSWLKRLPTRDKITLNGPTLFGKDSVGLIDRIPITYKRNWSVDIWHWPVRISSPERALLEMIDQLRESSDFNYMELFFETLHSLRPELLMSLLKACRSVKVRRLFFVFADLYEHAWCEYLDADQIDLGSGPRALIPGGKFHPAYQISVPECLLSTPYYDDCIF